MYRTEELFQAYRVRSRALTTWEIALQIGARYPGKVSELLSAPFSGTKLNVGRIRAIAKLIGFRGATHTKVTEQQTLERERIESAARAFWRGAK